MTNLIVEAGTSLATQSRVLYPLAGRFVFAADAASRI
jgi:hypothetical protein